VLYRAYRYHTVVLHERDTFEGVGCLMWLMDCGTCLSGSEIMISWANALYRYIKQIYQR